MYISGFELEYEFKDKQLEFLEPIIEEWARVNRDFMESTKDNLYWFNERANLSALAGAIWRSGGLAVEEYSALKSTDNDKEKMGRIDFLFKYQNKIVICEAKHAWLKMPLNKSYKDYETEMLPSIASSKEDIKYTLGSEKNVHDLGLGLAFFAPYWSSSEHKNNIEPDWHVKELKQQLKNMDNSFYAYLRCTSSLPLLKGSNKDEAYNSIVIVGNVV